MVNKVRKTDQRRNRYSREFKLDAIKLTKESGLPPRQVSINLGLPPQLVERWMKEIEKDEATAFPGVGKPKTCDKELHELRRKLKQTEEERDILKKALAIFSKAHK
jgi:transposase